VVSTRERRAIHVIGGEAWWEKCLEKGADRVGSVQFAGITGAHPSRRVRALHPPPPPRQSGGLRGIERFQDKEMHTRWMPIAAGHKARRHRPAAAVSPSPRSSRRATAIILSSPATVIMKPRAAVDGLGHWSPARASSSAGADKGRTIPNWELLRSSPVELSAPAPAGPGRRAGRRRAGRTGR
jgi:hypothetical protein